MNSVLFFDELTKKHNNFERKITSALFAELKWLDNPHLVDLLVDI